MLKSIINNLPLPFLLCFLFSCSKNDLSNMQEQVVGPIADGDYYVATWGNDTNSGTFDSPWATWQKAFSSANPGETVYFRGGVYYADDGVAIDPYRWPAGSWGHSGTEGNWIRYLNYPDETPILDFSAYKPEGNWNTALGIYYVTYMYFRGLTIRNVYQYRDGVTARGIEAYACSNIIFENMTVHDVNGRGFGFFGGFGAHGIDPLIPNVPYDTVRYINCDSYNNCDNFCNEVPCGSAMGGIGDGFKFNNTDGAYVSFEGCRAWNNSDDGFDPNGACFIFIDNCWSFGNGRIDGDGYGYKLAGPGPLYTTALKRLFTHNLSAFNKTTGIGLNFGMGSHMYTGHFYNNTFYKNRYGIAQSSTFLGAPLEIIFRNNIAYDNWQYNFDNIGAYIAENNNFNNTWPFADRIPTAGTDFESIDPRGLSGPRKIDGSLPDVNFLKPVKGSALVGLGYSE